MYIEKFLENRTNDIYNIDSILESMCIIQESFEENCKLLTDSSIVLEDSNKVLEVLTEGFISKIWNMIKKLIRNLKNWILKLIGLEKKAKQQKQTQDHPFKVMKKCNDKVSDKLLDKLRDIYTNGSIFYIERFNDESAKYKYEKQMEIIQNIFKSKEFLSKNSDSQKYEMFSTENKVLEHIILKADLIQPKDYLNYSNDQTSIKVQFDIESAKKDIINVMKKLKEDTFDRKLRHGSITYSTLYDFFMDEYNLKERCGSIELVSLDTVKCLEDLEKSVNSFSKTNCSTEESSKVMIIVQTTLIPLIHIAYTNIKINNFFYEKMYGKDSNTLEILCKTIWKVFNATHNIRTMFNEDAGMKQSFIKCCKNDDVQGVRIILKDFILFNRGNFKGYCKMIDYAEKTLKTSLYADDLGYSIGTEPIWTNKQELWTVDYFNNCAVDILFNCTREKLLLLYDIAQCAFGNEVLEEG